MRTLIAIVALLLPVFSFADDIEVLGGSTLREGTTEVVGGIYQHHVRFLGGTNLEESLTYVGPSTFDGSQPGKFVVGSGLTKSWHFLFVGLGLTASNRDDRYSGSIFNFEDIVGAQVTKHFSVRFMHYSNAGLFRAPNTGRDIILAGYSF